MQVFVEKNIPNINILSIERSGLDFVVLKGNNVLFTGTREDCFEFRNKWN